MKKATFHTIAGLLALGLAFGVNFAQAQAGILDTTFGTGGIVTTTLGGDSNNLTTLTAIEQANGDIAVVTGFNNEGNANPNGQVVALTRYASSGTLLGTTIASFFVNGINSPIAVAVQSNGDILVAATASAAIDGATSFGVARFTPNGQLDKTFGTGGLVITKPAGIFPSASAIIAQPNGQILVAGSTIGVNRNTPGGTVLVRYNSNGSLDTTFGTGGIMEAISAAGTPVALAELSNGSYLALGATTPAEFSSTGVLQTKVTVGKLVAETQSVSACCSPVLFQANGDFLIAQVGSGSGTGAIPEDLQRFDVQVSRLSEKGVVEVVSPAFMFGTNTQNSAQAIAVQSNGQIVVGGITFSGGGLGRLDSDLQLDTTFASGGTLSSDQFVSGLLIQKDGKIVAVGNIDGNLVLERYLAN